MGNRGMTSGGSAHQAYATYRQLLYWLLIYVLLDVIIWALIMYLYAAFIAPSKGDGMVHLGALLFFVPLGVIGKVGIFQFPLLLLFACVFRKKILLLKRCWILLPVSSIFATVIYIFCSSAIDDGWSKAWEQLSHEWTNYREPMHMLIPFAFLSALIATVPWMIFLNRKFKSMNG